VALPQDQNLTLLQFFAQNYFIIFRRPFRIANFEYVLWMEKFCAAAAERKFLCARITSLFALRLSDSVRRRHKKSQSSSARRLLLLSVILFVTCASRDFRAAHDFSRFIFAAGGSLQLFAPLR
jgi:hypothetical protein